MFRGSDAMPHNRYRVDRLIEHTNQYVEWMVLCLKAALHRQAISRLCLFHIQCLPQYYLFELLAT
ncbi:hypothetical protein E2C01_002670 [Portunus trituberculatus]|uniref:Uncharacterized protein n=1 Tax=Portunus trituberculatus TaxID=210409 RepID=A0A5B7CLD2_PORTR|nr:hypothetical protein [Portunus trituberculatus]